MSVALARLAGLLALGLVTASATRAVAQVSPTDTVARLARAFLRIELTQAFWDSDGRCECTPVSLDASAGVRLRHGLDAVGALDLGGGVGLTEDVGAVWGPDAGLFLRPDHRLRLVGRYRRYFPGARSRDNRYALAQVALQAHPFPAGGFARALHLSVGYATSRQTSDADAYGTRLVREEIRRGPVMGVGWGPR